MGEFSEGQFREICYVQPGDLVLARSETTGEHGLKRVVACVSHEGIELFKIYYIDARGPVALPILTTDDHAFWVDRSGWTPAGALRPGFKICTHNGFVEVRAARYAGVKTEVFEVEVEDFHSYFVGPSGLLVRDKWSITVGS